MRKSIVTIIIFNGNIETFQVQEYRDFIEPIPTCSLWAIYNNYYCFVIRNKFLEKSSSMIVLFGIYNINIIIINV